ncbi:MAG: 50S ribosomal protein L19 [Anaerolineales bacterium]|nr:MAG: 50S ribosomal protein L19 [Anaerolineales bacterium]
MNDLLKTLETPTNPDVPDIRSGDTVTVFVRIKEGENERIQQFKGTIIRIHGTGNSESFTVRRIASNSIGVERTFLTRSPIVEKVTVQSHGHTRRSRLYFLRERSGKKAKLRQKFTS